LTHLIPCNRKSAPPSTEGAIMLTFSELLAIASAKDADDGFDFVAAWSDAREDARKLPDCSITQALLLLLAEECAPVGYRDEERDVALFALESVAKDLCATIARLRRM